MAWRCIAQSLAVGLLMATAASSHSSEADRVASAAGAATLVELNGPIGPAMSHYIERSLRDATEQLSPVVILQIDTPGGLDTSMRGIIKGILASPIPVVELCGTEWRACGERRNLHLVCESLCGDGTGYELGCGHTDLDWRTVSGRATGICTARITHDTVRQRCRRNQALGTDTDASTGTGDGRGAQGGQ